MRAPQIAFFAVSVLTFWGAETDMVGEIVGLTVFADFVTLTKPLI